MSKSMKERTISRFYQSSFTLVLLFGVIGLLAGCGVNTTNAQAAATNTPPAAPQTTAKSGTQTPSQPSENLEQAVSTVAAEVRPAVVFIGIEQDAQNFGTPQLVGNGSGTIIDAQGHILTNNHVVENADALQVTLPDGRTFDATVVGRDPVTDLAVIQIHGDNLPTIPLGDSDALQLGEFVVAIGNALGLNGGPSVTFGVVSAKDRTIIEENGEAISGLLQTDAAVNPGNSGGPLVNLRGELVGINTAVPGVTVEGFQPSGISFAIAVNEAKPILQDLLTQGRVIRPYLGVVPVTITPALQAQLGLSVDKGVILAGVSPGSPAAQQGLQQGDIITQADGNSITSETDLRRLIQQHKVGDTMTLTILRKSQSQPIQVTVKLTESPPPQ